MSCIANQCCKKSLSRPFYIELTYSATISACSGSGQASTVGCKGVASEGAMVLFSP